MSDLFNLEKELTGLLNGIPAEELLSSDRAALSKAQTIINDSELEQERAHLETVTTLQEIFEKLEEEHDARIEFERRTTESAKLQKATDRRRFWATLIVALVGSAAAVGSLIATIVLS